MIEVSVLKSEQYIFGLGLGMALKKIELLFYTCFLMMNLLKHIIDNTQAFLMSLLYVKLIKTHHGAQQLMFIFAYSISACQNDNFFKKFGHSWLNDQ